MNDHALREAYARILSERRPTERADCVSPEGLAAVVSGDATEDERLQRLRHVAQCPSCRAELDLMRATAAAGRRSNAFRVPGLVAAAAVVLLIAGGTIVWRVTSGDSGPPVMRGSGAAVHLVAPLGNTPAEDARTLVWRPAAGALDYDVELLAPGGDVVFDATTTDTLVMIPESISLSSGREYRWRVRVLKSDGTRVTSGLQVFRIQSP